MARRGARRRRAGAAAPGPEESARAGTRAAARKAAERARARARATPPAGVTTTPPEPAGAAVLWWLGAALTFWSFGFTIMRGSDLWWHLAGGRRMVAERALPREDPFSFNAAHPWLTDAWLSDVSLHLWAETFGVASLVWWKWGLIVATFLVLVRLLRRLPGVGMAGAWAAAVAGAATAAPFLDVRPQLYSFLAFALALDLSLARPRPSLLLVPLFWVWTNLHAGFVIGVATLPLLLAPAWWRGDGAARRRLVGLAAACVLICLVNPNGIEVFSRPLIYAFDTASPYRNLGEWLPPFHPRGIRAPLLPYTMALFGVACVFLVARSRLRGVPWTMILLGLGTLVMSLRSRRFIPFFAITQALAVAPLVASLLAPVLRRLPPLVAPALAVALGVVWLAPYPLSNRAFHYLALEEESPVDTLDFMLANDLSGDVFAYYNWGGYLHYRTDGALKVFIDGRAETVFAYDTYWDYVAVLRGGPDPRWIDVVESAGSEYFLWPADGRGRALARALVATGRWQYLYEDGISLLLVRADLAPTRALAPAPPSPYGDFRLGVLAMREGRFADAEQHLTTMLERLPDIGRACFLLARAQGMQGKIDEARETARGCHARFPQPGRLAGFERWIAAHAAGRS